MGGEPLEVGLRALADLLGELAHARGQGVRVRNTLLVTGPTGGGDEIHTGYDKIHLFDAFGFAESDTVEPGDATRVVTVDGVGVGLSVCYDIRFPGQYTALASAGARLTLCSASWGAGPGKVDQWRLLARARALDSTTFLLAAGTVVVIGSVLSVQRALSAQRRARTGPSPR